MVDSNPAVQMSTRNTNSVNIPVKSERLSDCQTNKT